MISVDNYLNETTRHAHVILPGLSPLEQPHCDEVLWGFAVRSGVRWSPAIFPRDDRPHEWEILIRLGAILAGMPAPRSTSRRTTTPVRRPGRATWRGSGRRHGRDIVARPDRIVDLTIRMSPWGDGFGERPEGLTFDTLRSDYPHGVDFGPMAPRIDEILRTASGDVELAHDDILDDVPRLLARMERPRDGLLLIGRRHVRSNNSWMHNVGPLMKGRPRCTLIVHPQDAEAHGLSAGGAARIRSEAGEVEADVELDDDPPRCREPAARLGS